MTNRHWKKTAILVAAAFAGCGTEGESDPNVLQDSLPAGARTGETAGGEPGPGDAEGEVGLTATLSEWNIRLAQDTVAAGPIAIRARNIGQYPHVFEVEGQGQEWETEEIAPDQWAVLEVELEPGTYEVYCPLDDDHGDHDQQGMRTELVVRAAGP